MRNERQLAVAALLLTMLFWGSAAVFMRSLALALTPDNSLALRYAILTLINAAGLLILGTWRIRHEHWLRFLMTGIAGMGGYNFFVNAGFALVPAGIGTVITSIEPLLIALLAWVLLNEKPSRTIYIGIALAALGAIALFWTDLTSAGASGISRMGTLSLLACCVSWAIYTILAKPLLAHYDSFTVTAVTMLIAAPVLISLADEPLLQLAARLDTRQWLELMYLVIPNGLLGTMLWNYGTKHLTGAATGTFLYLIPVIGIACGALILGESITANVILGGVLTLAGVAIVQFGPALSMRR